MITSQEHSDIQGWLRGRLPESWNPAATETVVDREEVTVRLHLPDPELAASDDPGAIAEARAGRARAFREDTREQRIQIALEAEQRFGRKVSWGAVVGSDTEGAAGEGAVGEGEPHRELWTHVAAPVMTRLRQPQRIVLDTLVQSGVARSRSEALAWCVRLVGEHEGDWLSELRDAMSQVHDVRGRGPGSGSAA